MPPLHYIRPWVHYIVRRYKVELIELIDVHTTMLKASQNKNVLSCRLKAAWNDVLRIDSAERAGKFVCKKVVSTFKRRNLRGVRVPPPLFGRMTEKITATFPHPALT